MNKDWSRLDNAAKIFPSADSGANSQVFRFSCELKDPIDQRILQTALDETIEVFEVYRYIMKRGIFWYYLERSDIVPIVTEEHKPPCSAIYHRDRRNLLFSVTYFRNRINLEVYHVLSDGTGAMHFLRTLTAKYIHARYKTENTMPNYDASRTQMKADSFAKYYSDTRSCKKQKRPAACRLKGAKIPEDRLSIITGHISVKSALAAAHESQVTITAFLSALFMESIGEEISERAKRKDVVLAIPVNLRQFFPSKSARNFFSLVFTGYNFSENISSFNRIAAKINSDLKENLTPEKLAVNIDAFSNVENNFFAKIAPLFFKDICLKYAYRLSMRQSTATISNIGIVKMPEPLKKYIKSFDVYTGTNKVQICLCSYEDVLSISFTSPFVSTDIQRRFFRKLTARGIDVTIFSNNTGDDI